MKIEDKALHNSKLYNQMSDISLILIKRYGKILDRGKITAADKTAIKKLETKRSLLARKLVKI
jgi:hypothetical protein